MINSLSIQNMALIARADIEFCPGLNILSGETGAGKSVILDSVNFVLGAKADKSLIRYGEKACSVSAEFDISGNAAVAAELEDMGIGSEDGLLVVSRRLSDEGRSVIRVNGQTANATMLRRLTGHLVDVHGQSEHFFLLKESNQLKVIDGMAGERASAIKSLLSEKVSELKGLRKRLAALGDNESERNRRIDLLAYQIGEIKGAGLREGEEEELTERRNKLNSVEKILTSLREASGLLSEDGAALDRIRGARRALSSISSLDREYGAMENRLDSLYAEAEDIAETLSSLGEDVWFDADELASVESRLNEIRSLKRKYGPDIPSVLGFLRRAEEDYELLTHSAEEVERLDAAMASCRREIYSLCTQLTACRKEAAERFSASIVRELRTLNIPSAQFETEFSAYTEEDADRAGAEGLDEIRFLFSANAGEPVRPLSRIASGGEMSRLMLAIKTQLSGVNGISTYIFDEIDAGISGKTARIVAEKFAKISKDTQIIAVSHLAQIVCMADREFLIRKEEKDQKTQTHVIPLDREGRIGELVRLLGGDAGSTHAREHAEELLDGAQRYRDSL